MKLVRGDIVMILLNPAVQAIAETEESRDEIDTAAHQ
jgi:hypothetical protein